MPANESGLPNGIADALGRGVAHHQQGRLGEAEAIYRQILEDHPDQPDALHLLGMAVHQTGNSTAARDYMTRSLSLRPGNADAANNLGGVFMAMGMVDEAISRFQQALEARPGFAAARKNLGDGYAALDRPVEAVESYRQAVAIDPQFADAHINLGNALRNLDRWEEAVDSYQNAAALLPDSASAMHNLAGALTHLGRMGEAFKVYHDAVNRWPGDDALWDGLELCLQSLSFTAADDALCQTLLALLERPRVRPHAIAGPILGALRHHPGLAPLLERAGGPPPGAKAPDANAKVAETARQLSSIPLLLRLMELSPIADPSMEQLLTGLRRALVQAVLAGEAQEDGLPFAAALALHCFTNEYVFFETGEEHAAVDRLQRQMKSLAQNREPIPAAHVAALAAYRPLHRFPWAAGLMEAEWPAPVRDIVTRQVAEPLAEQALRSRIPRLTAIENGVSREVRQQYEENPYPRWIKTGTSSVAKPIGDILRGPPLNLDLENYVSPENPEILIAGCGTGQHGVGTATTFLNARVLAVDLSLASLGYAARKTDELGIANIEYAQADILELAAPGLIQSGQFQNRRFDLIESVGVLHHLDDPVAGWRVLMGLLRPGGLMKIGLYSETARRAVVRARALIAEKGYEASAEGIRRYRRDVMALDENSEDSKPAGLSDFYSLSECRDLLFHVREHRFTLPQIEAALDTLGLRFLGFDLADQDSIRHFNQVNQVNPAAPETGTPLSRWHAFEQQNPDTFRGMYVFWCQKP